MLKAMLAGLLLPGLALLISTPEPSFADSDRRLGSRIRNHDSRPGQSHRRHHIQKRRRHHRHVRGHRHHRHHDVRRHRRHRHHRGHQHRHRRHAPHISIRIGGHHHGGHHHRPHYPHGHPRHVHDDYCPVVVSPRPVVIVPTWEVYYHSHRHHAAAILHIVVAPFEGELYIDGEYYGRAHDLDRGQLELPVSPGLHTVQLRHGGQAYTQKVRVQPGATAVVKAKKY